MQLPVLPKLARLWLADTNIDGSCLEHISMFSEIDTLDLAGTKVTDESLVFLSALKKLKRLDLRGTPITDAGVKHLLNCPKLYVVNFSDTGVTDEGAIALTSAFELFRIDLDGTSISDKLVESLVETSWESLRILRLRNTKVTSAIAPLFGRLEAMTTLDVRDTAIPYEEVAYLEDSLLNLNQPE
jgi:Leucine-rich repeat (LRR) protein